MTFNCLNIDGCQSTNDTVAIMASGSSDVEPEAGEFADVFVDPLVGEWDPAFRQLTPAGG